MTPNPWLGRSALCFAHQGGAKEGPSSTLAAMDLALQSGADALELDIHATADGHLVCCHDPTLDRTTNGSGRIAELSIEEIRSLDAAFWFVPGLGCEDGHDPAEYVLRGRAVDDPRYRVPTLAEVLEAFPGVPVNLDIKETAPGVAPYEELLAHQLVAAGRVENVMVASFHPAALERFAALGPDVATAAHPGEVATFVQGVVGGGEVPALERAALQIPARFAGVEVATPELVQAAHELSLAVHVWTIDDAQEAARLVRMGVDGVMTDRPGAISQAMASARGVRPGG